MGRVRPAPPRARSRASPARSRCSCFAALLVNDLIAGTRSQALLWLAACSLVTVPAAFLAGLLRSRLARGGLTDLFRGLGTLHGADLAGGAREGARRPEP